MIYFGLDNSSYSVQNLTTLYQLWNLLKTE
jgi:hypothetical protein